MARPRPLVTDNPGALSVVEPEEGDEVGSRFDQLIQARQQVHGRFMQSGANALRAHGQVITEELGRERLQLAHENLQLNREKELANIQKQRAAMELQLTQQKHTVAALDAVTKLDPSDENYHVKLAEAIHDNPMATKDPIFQDIVKAQIATRHVQQQAASEIAVTEAKQATEYEARHGIEVPINEKTGRPDFAAADANRAMRDQEAQARLAGQVDPALKASETIISGGKVTQRFKAPAPDKPPVPDVTTTVTKDVPEGEKPIVTTTVRHVGGPTVSAVPVATPPPVPRVKLKFDNGNLVPVE